jgi:mono/diheme cytochrome c family protein
VAGHRALAAGALTVALAGLTGWAWASDRSAPAASEPAIALDGRALFRAKGCATCHDGPDSRSPSEWAPSLARVSEWAGERRPPLAAADYVRQSIQEPGAFISPALSEPMAVMPGLNVSPAELDALVTYLLGE